MIEKFDRKFMGPFLASSEKTTFFRNDLREVHTVIDEEMA